MATRVDEIADGIFRLSTHVAGVAGPAGFTFNQFLIRAEQPLLYHCGQRGLFPDLARAAATVVDPARLRWIAFSHVESDECGSLNEGLTLAPGATAAQGAMGCALWLDDWAARKPRRLKAEERIDLGGKTVRYLDTPHVPHELDAGLLYEETTGTLLCSDLFSHTGNPPALTSADLLDAAIATDAFFPFVPLTPQTGRTIRKLAALQPRTLAVMHGSCFSGEAAPMLVRLAEYYEDKLRKALSAPAG